MKGVGKFILTGILPKWFENSLYEYGHFFLLIFQFNNQSTWYSLCAWNYQHTEPNIFSKEGRWEKSPVSTYCQSHYCVVIFVWFTVISSPFPKMKRITEWSRGCILRKEVEKKSGFNSLSIHTLSGGQSDGYSHVFFQRFGAEWDITLWFISKDEKTSSGQV